jgi:pyruvate,orthophosphate dikinase
MNDISHDSGTAVNVQMMVFVIWEMTLELVLLFKKPANGEDHIYGEFLENAQGEDVVAGIRTPLILKN